MQSTPLLGAFTERLDNHRWRLDLHLVNHVGLKGSQCVLRLRISCCRWFINHLYFPVLSSRRLTLPSHLIESMISWLSESQVCVCGYISTWRGDRLLSGSMSGWRSQIRLMLHIWTLKNLLNWVSDTVQHFLGERTMLVREDVYNNWNVSDLIPSLTSWLHSSCLLISHWSMLEWLNWANGLEVRKVRALIVLSIG